MMSIEKSTNSAAARLNGELGGAAALGQPQYGSLNGANERGMAFLTYYYKNKSVSSTIEHTASRSVGAVSSCHGS
jgi:hypothetical protein